jgi:hypothetical protein
LEETVEEEEAGVEEGGEREAGEVTEVGEEDETDAYHSRAQATDTGVWAQSMCHRTSHGVE